MSERGTERIHDIKTEKTNEQKYLSFPILFRVKLKEMAIKKLINCNDFFFQILGD